MRFTDVLRQHIAEKGLRQKDVAGMIGCSPAYIGHLVTGHVRPPMHLVAKVCDALRLSDEDADRLTWLAQVDHCPDAIRDRLLLIEEALDSDQESVEHMASALVRATKAIEFWKRRCNRAEAAVRDLLEGNAAVKRWLSGQEAARRVLEDQQSYNEESFSDQVESELHDLLAGDQSPLDSGDGGESGLSGSNSRRRRRGAAPR